ncbi:MAG: hypothetical protein D4R84_03680 [Rhodocyclaceae bacterium]|nr:MAG: hypothetical protein D4R84_03680 [Rhodocyclaceae bacterium]
MLKEWFTRLESVREAVTREEREAVYRLRYNVYIGELKRKFPDADHGRKWLHDNEDEKPHTTILYTGTLANMTGTLRVRTWGPGQVPPRESKWWSMERFPGIEAMTTAELGRLTVRPDARGRLILPALLRTAYEHCAGARRVDLAFCFCSPGLVRNYQRLGMSPFGGRLVDSGTGSIQIPLVTVLSDAAHFKRCGSFLEPVVKKYFGPGKRTPLDTAPLRKIIDTDEIPVESDPAKVWEAVEEAFDPERSSETFIDACAFAMKKLTRSGFVLNLKEGELLLREGISEKEVFVILDGAFEVFQAKRQICILAKGDLLGEVAFFSPSGQRTASVRALTKGRLLVLRRKFLQELTHADPEMGYQVLMNMSRVMAARLERMLKGGQLTSNPSINTDAN